MFRAGHNVENMAPQPDVDVDRRHPILVAHIARADGSARQGLRVYCGARGGSVPLDVCRQCSGCHEIADGEKGADGWVRCTPPAERGFLGERLLSVGDALQRGVVVVEEDVRVGDVVALFTERALRLVVVIDRSGQVAGVVHDSHLMPQIQAHAHATDPPDAPRLGRSRMAGSTVSEVMTSTRCVPEAMSLRAALDEMAALRQQRLVAVDDEGRPVGLLVDVHALRTLRSEEERFR